MTNLITHKVRGFATLHYYWDDVAQVRWVGLPQPYRPWNQPMVMGVIYQSVAGSMQRLLHLTAVPGWTGELWR